jgi:hypothetical protein
MVTLLKVIDASIQVFDIVYFAVSGSSVLAVVYSYFCS